MKTFQQFNEGLKDYINRGKYQQMPDEDTASFGKLFKNDLQQMTRSDDAFKKGKKGITTLRPLKAFTDPKMRATGPTPLFRQTPRLIKQGVKSVGRTLMKNKKFALGALAVTGAVKGIQSLRGNNK
tara:strand:- start:509 stop:886 length:378 start_codon:yes stop_codon:yes gene_type:complete